MIRFDAPALHLVLDAQRRHRGMSWAELARQTGVAQATIARMRRRGRFEVDGALAMTRWLGRRIEDFTYNDGA